MIASNRKPRTEIPSHPLADILPLMEDAYLDAMAKDIKKNGLREPIIRYEDKILDGRIRYRACRRARVAPTFADYTGDDPVGYVVSNNAPHRHLNDGERAIAAGRLCLLPKETGKFAGADQAEAAEVFNVTERTVRESIEILKDGVPQLLELVTCGEVAVSAAVEVARLFHPRSQRKIVARGVRHINEIAAEIQYTRRARFR